MKGRASASALVLALAAALGTAAVFVLPDPDRAAAVSDDGRFTAKGPFSAINVGHLPDRVSHAGAAPVYRVSVHDDAPMRPYEVSLAYDPAWAKQRFQGAVLSLWGYDPAVNAWRHAVSTDERSAGRVTADGKPGVSEWTVWAHDGSSSLSTDTLLDALISFPPPGTVGYEAYSTVAEPGGEDFFLVTEPLARGGCAGAFAPAREVIATKEVVEPSGTTRVAVRFQVGEGCPPEAPLAPAP